MGAFKEGLQELFIYFKDWLLSKTILVRNRQMFYLEKSSFSDKVWRVVCSKRKITHSQWFTEINILFGTEKVSLEDTIRGYYNPKSQVLFLYSGLKHSLPNPSICNEYAFLTVYNYFKKKGVKEFRLGSSAEGFSRRWRTLIGKDFEPIMYLDTNALKNSKCVYIKKISLK